MPERELTLDWKPPPEARAVSKRHRSYFGLRERVLRKVSWEGVVDGCFREARCDGSAGASTAPGGEILSRRASFLSSPYLMSASTTPLDLTSEISVCNSSNSSGVSVVTIAPAAHAWAHIETTRNGDAPRPRFCMTRSG